jgi:hypothetical protein
MRRDTNAPCRDFPLSQETVFMISTEFPRWFRYGEKFLLRHGATGA